MTAVTLAAAHPAADTRSRPSRDLANKYEGLVVWLNALIAGAGGEIATDTDKGVDATIDVGSQAGEDASAIVEEPQAV